MDKNKLIDKIENTQRYIESENIDESIELENTEIEDENILEGIKKGREIGVEIGKGVGLGIKFGKKIGEKIGNGVKIGTGIGIGIGKGISEEIRNLNGKNKEVSEITTDVHGEDIEKHL